ncbi:FG-GAP repeat domain-containing protein [Granulosicoccus antarcticus]|uniref:FG-GAP repeat protein n=1 Tax=Granulosicoccus antarcticus IMCC3135 TaxID=1192854 RepID=A0A2Z2NVA0_9GAMM|nr:VCBS repeat-containing protein [Granulosicoccus antarcticus]ASJ71587.1 hypothetical protein IMCC3135_07405 [Granulosicoccus antarcticus IMCC3135]
MMNLTNFRYSLILLAILAGCSSSDSTPNTVPDNTGDTDTPLIPGDIDGDSDGDVEAPEVPTASQIIYLDNEAVSLPTGGLFLVSEYIGDLNNDGKGDILADTSTFILGSENSEQDVFASNERISTALELFSATVLDFNGNGVADILLPNYEGNLPQSRFGGFDLVLDRSDLSTPIVFDGTNGGRIKGVEPGQENMSFTSVGDVNGDGRDDLAGYLGGSLTQAGAAMVVLYGANGLPEAENDVTVFSGSAVDRLVPANNVRFEGGRVTYVLPLGDINQDGLDDFALRYSYPQGADVEGDRSFDMLIVYGATDGIVSVEAFDAETSTSAGTRFADSLIQETAGDFNADGVTDLVIASETIEGNRTVYSEGVLLGQDWQSQSSFSAAELAEHTITFTGYGADFGSIKLHSAGDFNGDGFDDLLVEDAARMILIPAGIVGSVNIIDLNDLPAGSVEFRASSETDAVYTYEYLDSQADVNGDGFDDLLVYSQSAGVRVLFGKAQF